MQADHDGRVSATMCEWHDVSTNLRQCPHLLVVAKGFRGLFNVGGELECPNEGNELPIRHSARLSTRRAVADRLARPDRPTRPSAPRLRLFVLRRHLGSIHAAADAPPSSHDRRTCPCFVLVCLLGRLQSLPQFVQRPSFASFVGQIHPRDTDTQQLTLPWMQASQRTEVIVVGR